MKNKFQELNPDGTVKVTKKTKSAIRIAIQSAIALVVIGSSFTIVPAGHTGVVLTLGKVSENILQEGFNFKVPFIQSVIKTSNKIQVYEVSTSAVSKDLQSVSSNIAVNYRISTDASAKLYQDVGTAYSTVLLAPIVQESMKSVTAKYTAEQLITERAVVADEVKSTLDEKLNEYGICIEKFNIVNFDFSVEFNSAIEAKQVAEQNLIKTRTEQEQAIVIAEAQAKEITIAADAEAAAILARAESQAEANKLLEESLSEIVVKYEQIAKWDGALPKVTSDSGVLIDMELDSLSDDTSNSSSNPTVSE